MEKFSKIVIVLIAIFLGPVCLMAQTPSNKDARYMNYMILKTIDSYSRTSTLYNASYKNEFLKLFSSPKTECIYNDMMNSAKYQKTISAEEYVSLYVPGNDVMLETDVSSVKFIGPYEFRDGKWYRKVSVTKSVKIIDSRHYTQGAGGVLYDSKQLYPKDPDYTLELEMLYDSNQDVALINSIDIALAKEKTPLDDAKYSVIVKSGTKYDSKLTSNGSPIVFNDFNEAFTQYNNYNLNDEDVKITANEVGNCETYNVLELKFKPKHFRLKLRAAFSPMGAYNVKATNINSKSSGMEFGLDFGYMFSAGSMKIGPFIGAAISKSKISLSKDSFSYAYLGKISDHSGEMYTRKYDISAVNEGLSFTDIVVPVYFEAEHRLGRVVKLTWDIGAKLYLNNTTNHDTYNVVGKSYGVYDNGRVVTESQEDGFGELSTSFDEFLVPVDYSRNSLDITLFGMLGFDFRISSSFSINVSAGYEMGMKESYKSSESKYFDEQNGIFPFVYSTQNKKDIAVRSFLDCISYKRQGMLLSVGFKYKF